MRDSSSKTVSERREEKAWIGGDHAAWTRDQLAIRRREARGKYLRDNPDVGVLIRDGKEVFYRNLRPLRSGQIEEFTPDSVLG